MLRAVSFERAEFLLRRQISEGWIEEYTADDMYRLAGSVRKYVKKWLCIEKSYERLEIQQVDSVKKAIQRCDVTPAGGVFIADAEEL